MLFCVYLGDEAGLLEISPAYYPQTTLLPTHLYFTVRLLVVHSQAGASGLEKRAPNTREPRCLRRTNFSEFRNTELH